MKVLGIFRVPSTAFDSPNVPYDTSEGAHLFAHNSSYFAPGICQPSLPAHLGINPSSESLSSELLRSYCEACSQYPDSSSDFSCSEEEDDLVYACVDFKTKSFVGVSKKNDKQDPTITITRGFYGLSQEDEVNIKEIPSYETLLESAGYPSILPAPTDDHQSVGSMSESEAVENQVLGDSVGREICAAPDTNNTQIGNTVPANLAKGDDALTAAKKFRLMAMHYSKCKWPGNSSSDSEVVDDEWESSS